MTDKQTSRRTVLKSGAAMASLGLVGSLSGCSVPFVGGDGGDGSGETGSDGRADNVPEGSDFIFHVSVGAMLSDDVVRDRINELLQSESGGEGPQSIEDVFSQVESEAGFDPSAVSEMLAFGSSSNEQLAGSILWTDWDQSAVTSSLEEQGFNEVSYGDKTLYNGSSGDSTQSWVGLLDGSTYAFGSEVGVKAAVDTWTGDGNSVSGKARTAYESAQGGYVQFGFDVPNEQMGGDNGTSSGQAGMGGQALNNIDYGYGSVTSGNNGRSLVVNLEATDSDSAEGLKTFLDLGLAEAKSQLNSTASQGGVDQQQSEELRQALENITINRNGSTITIENQDGIDFALLGLGVAATFAVGLGSSSGMGESEVTRTPNAQFQFDYDDSSRELTVTHAGGDTIEANNLLVQRVSQQPRSWAELGGAGEVTAGDRVVLSDVSSSYKVAVIWQSGDNSAILAEVTGPDA